MEVFLLYLNAFEMRALYIAQLIHLNMDKTYVRLLSILKSNMDNLLLHICDHNTLKPSDIVSYYFLQATTPTKAPGIISE